MRGKRPLFLIHSKVVRKEKGNQTTPPYSPRAAALNSLVGSSRVFFEFGKNSTQKTDLLFWWREKSKQKTVPLVQILESFRYPNWWNIRNWTIYNGTIYRFEYGIKWEEGINAPRLEPALNPLLAADLWQFKPPATVLSPQRLIQELVFKI